MKAQDPENQPLVQKALLRLHSMLKPKQGLFKADPEVEIHGKKYRLASFNKRLFTSALDMLIMSILVFPLGYIVSWFGIGDAMVSMKMKPEFMLDNVDGLTLLEILYDSGVVFHILMMQLILFTSVGIYMIIFWRKKLATPAKMLFKCQVVDAKTYGQISITQGIIRFISIPLSIMPLLAGLFMIDWNDKRQALHDKTAGTVVIYKNDKDN